jgi:K+-transporting ATPase ATPase C chain
VAQWAAAHTALAQNWVKADNLNGDYVTVWAAKHPSEVDQWKKENSDNKKPKPEDYAGLFFTGFSKEFPGRFPIAAEHKSAEGKTEKAIEPAKEGADIQSIFFDMWLRDHATADLEPVPADMVMASGSGLDPHITLKNALYQLDRVAGKWAAETKSDAAKLRTEIQTLLRQKIEAPLGGLVGVELVNVLEVNLALRDRYRPAVKTGT